jgi:outer membrane immunogenic protein
MKRLLLASTVLALGSPAFAAPPHPAAPTYSWTGCYAGAHVGTGWGRNDISEPTNAAFQTFAPANSPIGVDSGAGFLGGVQAGCDYQFATSWVVGLRGDFSWANISGQADDPFFAGKNPGPITLTAKTDWIASAEARIGYAWDRWMLYGTGGPAWAHNKYGIQNLTFFGTQGIFCVGGGSPIACNPTGSDTRLGWTLGIGLGWAFAKSWTAGLEYAHYDFGSRSVTLNDYHGDPLIFIASGPVDVKQQIDTLKLSINYRFGWPSVH